MKITKGTIVRTIMIAVVVINLVLKQFNIDVIKVDEGTVTSAVETIVQIAIIAIGFWENNSFSENAKKADVFLQELNKTE